MSAVVSATTVAVLVSAVALFSALAAPPASMDQTLEPIRKKNRLPALAAAVVRNGHIVASGASGFRKEGSPERVTVKDQWHIGSCTKSMTAALAAMMVDEGQWRWDMKVTEMFPELADKITREWRGATLEEFLTHYSGAGNEDWFDAGILAWAKMPPLKQRAAFVHDCLIGHAPTTKPGTVWKYDNANYIVVGHAMELKLRQPWEDIIRERLFKPLGMDSAGFGPPARGRAIDEPWGHVVVEGGRITPMPPDATGEAGIWVAEMQQKAMADNPAALGPAGMVHCSIGDLAKYATWQLRGARGQGTLLKAATFKKLHTRFKKDGNYAFGWSVEHRDWAGGDSDESGESPRSKGDHENENNEIRTTVHGVHRQPERGPERGISRPNERGNADTAESQGQGVQGIHSCKS
ncbi:MAG TPA: serine hydrolase domain-containing protein [Candidatus Paceibacterota bacterium]|nr:serine hydrolase domain-containing protein [Candidatus Paceibacterota bacterium]